MKNLISLLALVMTVVLSGCASVPMASLENDKAAKDFSEVPGKGSLFIYRNETMGAALPLAVSVNGKTLGQTAAMTYFRMNVAPGKYNVVSHAENVSEISLDINAGKNYFVWQEIKMGMFSARSKLQQVDESKGRAGVSESKLISSTINESEFNVASDQGAKEQLSLANSSSQKLRDLQSLNKEGVITDEEFNKKKQQLLQEL